MKNQPAAPGFLLLAATAFTGCKKSGSDSSSGTTTANIVFKFKFDSTQVWLNNKEVSSSTNKSFEWTEVIKDGLWEPAQGENVVDMGVRGMLATIK